MIDWKLKVPETGTGMEFEGDFRSYLFTFEEAMEKITVKVDRHVLHTAWTAWQTALEIDRGVPRKQGATFYENIF